MFTCFHDFAFSLFTIGNSLWNCFVTYRMHLSRNMHDNFVEDAEIFFKSLLSKEYDDSLKWKSVVNYIKCNRLQIQGLCYVELWHDKNAFITKFCSVLSNALKELRCDDKILLTSLIDLITILSLKTIYLSKYLSKREYYVKTVINNLEWNTENSIFSENQGIPVFNALRGNYQLMELLIKYGLVKSFSGESQLLKARTEEILTQLL